MNKRILAVRVSSILLFITFLCLLREGLAQQNEIIIKLPNRVVKTNTDIEHALKEKLAWSTFFPIHGFIMLNNLPTRESRYLLKEAGITLNQYLGRNVYYTSFAENTDFSAIKDYFQYCGVLVYEDKLHQDILKNKIKSWAITDDNQVKVLVHFFKEFEASVSEKLLGSFTKSFTKHGEGFTYKLELSLDGIKSMAKQEIVKWVEPGPRPMKTLEGGLN